MFGSLRPKPPTAEEAPAPEFSPPKSNSPPVRILFPSPIGDVGLTFVDQVVVGVKIAPKGREKRNYAPAEEAFESEFLEEVFGRLSEYFAGARPSPDLEWDLLDPEVTPFARRVLKEAAKIPYGKTRTYRKIAAAAGKPDAYRVVLAVLASNPLPIVVPCHRVVTNKSGIGSYIGGRDRKRWLLQMEKEGFKSGAA